MQLYEPRDFISGSPQENVVFNPEEIPTEMNIFFRSERSFLPSGKDFKDLTPAEKERLKHQYRFSPYRPGMYQTLTKLGAMT